MKKHIIRTVVFTTLIGLTLAASAADETDQSAFPQITAQPTDQAVAIGVSTVLTVEAVNADGYQWFHNGIPIEGQTNSTFSIEHVGTNDVGFYYCYVAKGAEAVPSRAASLSAFTSLLDGQFTVYALPVVSGGSQGSCPGSYAGYASYTKTVGQGWGWAPSSGTTTHTASDGNRSDTKVLYVGYYGDGDCGQTTITVPDPTESPKYRFTIYFSSNVPTNSYGITLTGFDP